jgi:hypothetical protein
MGLGIQMAAYRHRQAVFILSGTMGKHIAQRIKADATSCLLTPAGKKLARFFIARAEGKPATSAFWQCVNFCHLHDGLP